MIPGGDKDSKNGRRMEEALPYVSRVFVTAGQVTRTRKLQKKKGLVRKEFSLTFSSFDFHVCLRYITI